MTKLIPLTHGKSALVDDADFAVLMQYKWHARYDAGWRAAARINGKYTAMHRFILGVTDPKIEVDHKNHNGLDNRRTNLRLATHKQNGENRRGAAKQSTSGVRGVSKHQGKYMARVQHNGVQHYLGIFTTLEEADEAARAARKRLFTHD